MSCIEIENGFICFSKTNFSCPECGKEYNDDNDKYLNRCNKNKSFCTTVKCESCGNNFGVTYDYKGDMVSFKK